MSLCAIAALASLPFALSAHAAETKFETRLLPSAVSDLSAAATTGDGAATAMLQGDKLIVSGSFSGLSGPATDAHVFLGDGIGIPGSSILDLTLAGSDSGTISGTFTLNRKQEAALRSGHLYVQINSQKAAAPYGNLWGWLLPTHPDEAQDVPQEGHWFQPQYDVPQSK